MMTVIIIIHVIICALLITIILIQAGRGGGFVESLSGMESMLGTKTSSFLTRATTILASLFFVTCIGLAFMSAQRGKSIMRNVKVPAAQSAGTPKQATPAKADLPETGVAEKTNVPEMPKAGETK